MSRRQNEQWVVQLRGDEGPEVQRVALEDLYKYLWTVAKNFLLYRMQDEASAKLLAPEFVQEVLYDLAKDDYALLEKYRGEGKFTSWTAKICARKISKVLNKPSLPQVRSTDPDTPDPTENIASSRKEEPENKLQQQSLLDALEKCLNELAQKYRIALDTILLGIDANEAGKRLGGVPANTVHTYVYRGKAKLKRCLESSGYTKGIVVGGL